MFLAAGLSILTALYFTSNVDSKTLVIKMKSEPVGNFLDVNTTPRGWNHTQKHHEQVTMVSTKRPESRVERQLEQLKEKVDRLTNEVERKSMYCEFLTTDICGPCNCVDERRLPKKYYCDCRHLEPQRDCLEFRQNNHVIDGIYKVTQNHFKTIEVFCDQTTDNGGWTVFQRRFDGSESFHRDWEMYKVGFGDLQFEYWLGNENIHTLVLHSLYYNGTELRVDLMDWDRKLKYAHYDYFQVGTEEAKYELHVGGYNGTAGDAFSMHNKLDFTTIDEDYDTWTGGNCAQKYSGGWWYAGTSCVGGATLNHNYYQLGMPVASWYGIVWTGLNSASRSLKRTEMKFRRNIK